MDKPLLNFTSGQLAGQHLATAVAEAESFDAEALLRHALAVQAATITDEARRRFCNELATTLNVLALQFAPAGPVDAN
jgi:hypothetical protein